MNTTSIIVAGIGAVTAMAGAFFTSQATIAASNTELNTKVELVKQKQELQYTELKGSLERIEKKLDSALK